MNLKNFIFDQLNHFVEKKVNFKKVKKTLKKIIPYDVGYRLIRLGEDSDGGYLIPNDLKGVKYCYSAGVGFVTKFENDLMKKYNIKSFMIDPNKIPKKIIPKKAKFINKHLAINENKDAISINKFLNHNEDIIFKMDIEGDEYLNLINIDEKKLSKIRIMILELHDLRNLRSQFFFKTFDQTINKLSKYFYFCHLHPNNTSKITKIGKIQIPDMLEVTLINKKRVKFIPKVISTLPHKLDKKVDPNMKDILLDKKILN